MQGVLGAFRELDSAVQSMRGKFRRLPLRDVTIWPQLP